LIAGRVSRTLFAGLIGQAFERIIDPLGDLAYVTLAGLFAGAAVWSGYPGRGKPPCLPGHPLDAGIPIGAAIGTNGGVINSQGGHRGPPLPGDDGGSSDWRRVARVRDVIQASGRLIFGGVHSTGGEGQRED
jgi:hypothetical protein